MIFYSMRILATLRVMLPYLPPTLDDKLNISLRSNYLSMDT